MTSLDHEIDLLACSRDGDASAFPRLVEQFGARVHAYFHRLCRDVDRAEDLTQELFTRLVAALARYRTAGRLSVYVFRVARNLWIDHYRQVRARPRLHSYDQPLANGEPAAGSTAHATDEPGPMQVLERRDDVVALRRAVAALPAAQRQVLVLAVEQELPYAEIASRLGIPVGTVKSRVHHAVAALRRALGGVDDAPARGDRRSAAVSRA
jgi:RNA polymerase sigma-70 factor (ECF subfamily)